MTQSLNDHTQQLVDEFGIDESIVDNALEARRQRGGSLDTALLECGIREETILAWMSSVFELPSTQYSAIRDIPQDLAQEFPRHVAETFRVFPTELDQEKAVLVCYQPLVERLRTQLKHRLERNIEFTVTTETNFHAGLQHLYGKPPRPRWSNIIDELEAKIQETIDQEAELEELGLQGIEEPPATPEQEATPQGIHVAFWAVGERRGEEFIISSMSTDAPDTTTVVPLLSLPWLPEDEGKAVALSAETLNDGPLGDTLRFRTGEWQVYQSSSAELSVYVIAVDGGLPEVEKLALDVALGKYRRPEEADPLLAEALPRRVHEETAHEPISQLVVPQEPQASPKKVEADFGKILGLFTSHNPELWSEALELLDDASESATHHFISEHFPGNIQVDALNPEIAGKPLDTYSGIIHACCHRLGRVVGALVPFLESNAINTRYFATKILAEHGKDVAFDLKLVARRLFDREREIRRAAVQCLEQCREEPAYSEIIGVFEERLKVPVAATQIATIHILGQLRELRGVTQIVNLCAAEEVMVAKAAQSFMALITGHHFGADIDAWKAWWVNHGHSSRSVWLVRALRSRDARLRQVAIDELRRLHSNEDFGFEPQARSPRREKSVRQWEELLIEEGLVD